MWRGIYRGVRSLFWYFLSCWQEWEQVVSLCDVHHAEVAIGVDDKRRKTFALYESRRKASQAVATNRKCRSFFTLVGSI